MGRAGGESEEHGSLCLALPSLPLTQTDSLFYPQVAPTIRPQVMPSSGIHASAGPSPLLSSVMGRQVLCQGVSWAGNCLSV